MNLRPRKIRENNERIMEAIRRVCMDSEYAYDPERLLDQRIGRIARERKRVLDFGKSTRHRFEWFARNSILTADINQFGDYPDAIVDICDETSFPEGPFDAIICLAVLEHVYNPEQAVRAVRQHLAGNGVFFGFVPFLYRYHAPEDLHYQDFFRFSRDGLAYLLRDFSEVTLYPQRGRYSTAVNLFGGWKHHAERLLGTGVNRLLDRLPRGASDIQVSGYFFEAIK